MATKTKTKKIDTLYPPKDIRDNTKERRAWVAAKVAEINAQPNRMAKSVGAGSYQSVSVYEVTEVEGRERHRGVCQCCGHAQVVDDRGMVLHGYKRPGWGTTVGSCPGVGYEPLNVSDEQTRKWLAEAEAEVVKATAARQAAHVAQGVADRALHPELGVNLEPDARRVAPRRPSTRYGYELTGEALTTYLKAKEEWDAAYPLTAALIRAQLASHEAENTLYRWEQTAQHFKTLLESGVKGTPLTREVVA